MFAIILEVTLYCCYFSSQLKLTMEEELNKGLISDGCGSPAGRR